MAPSKIVSFVCFLSATSAQQMMMPNQYQQFAPQQQYNQFAPQQQFNPWQQQMMPQQVGPVQNNGISNNVGVGVSQNQGNANVFDITGQSFVNTPQGQANMGMPQMPGWGNTNFQGNGGGYQGMPQNSMGGVPGGYFPQQQMGQVGPSTNFGQATNTGVGIAQNDGNGHVIEVDNPNGKTLVNAPQSQGQFTGFNPMQQFMGQLPPGFSDQFGDQWKQSMEPKSLVQGDTVLVHAPQTQAFGNPGMGRRRLERDMARQRMVDSLIHRLTSSEENL